MRILHIYNKIVVFFPIGATKFVDKCSYAPLKNYDSKQNHQSCEQLF